MFVELTPLNYEDFGKNEKAETSYEIKQRIENARNIQMERYKKEEILTNNELNNNKIDKYCFLDVECKKFIKEVFNKYKFSSRSYYKLLKTSRTIADLDNSENINIRHVSEAISFRKAYYTYWSNFH